MSLRKLKKMLIEKDAEIVQACIDWRNADNSNPLDLGAETNKLLTERDALLAVIEQMKK